MERFSDIVNDLDNEDLEYLLIQITNSIENSIDSLIPLKRLNRLSEDYDLTEEDFMLFQDAANYILVESTSKKDFDVGEEILEKLKISEEKIQVFQEVFQEQAQTIWTQIKGQAHATPNLVDKTSARVTLPLYESHNPLIQEFTFNQKLKYSYSDDVKNPRLQMTFQFKNKKSGVVEEGHKRTGDFVVEMEKGDAQRLFEETERIKEHLDMLLAKV